MDHRPENQLAVESVSQNLNTEKRSVAVETKDEEVNMSRVVLRAGAVIACLVAVMKTADAGLILNPSFESPVLPANGLRTLAFIQNSTPGWKVLYGRPLIITDGYANGGVIWADPTDGNQYLYVGDSQQAASVYQDLTLEANASYLLTFDMANYLTIQGNGAKLTVDIATLGVSVLPQPAIFERPAGTGYASQSLSFTTTSAGTYRLSLTQEYSFGTNVDNFQLVRTPEPTSLALAGFAGIGMAVGAWRRRRLQAA